MLERTSIKRSIVIYLTVLCILMLSIADGGCDNLQNNSNESNEHTPPPSKYAYYPTVVIDAGHGGEDGGAVGEDGTLEKHLNLEIALELDEMLRSMGVKTRLTRIDDVLLYDRNSDYEGHKKAQDAAARIAIAEEYDDAIFISIHMNSFPQKKYHGLQVYYSEFSGESSKIANEIQSLTVKNLQPDNKRQIKLVSKNVYIMNKIKQPAVLVECGFLSNPDECARLKDKEYQSKLSLVICGAILNYFDGMENNPAEYT